MHQRQEVKAVKKLEKQNEEAIKLYSMISKVNAKKGPYNRNVVKYSSK